ncbi:MAG: hypothetical protein ACRC46_03790 [Thermoguttaceae bacterium]
MKRSYQIASAFFPIVVLLAAVTPMVGAAAPRSVSGANGNVTVEIDVRGQERARTMPADSQASQPASQHQHRTSSSSSSRPAPQNDDNAPSIFDKFKSSMSSFGRRVFGDDEAATSAPSSSASATAPASDGSRNFGSEGNSTSTPTTPPRTVPPKPVTGSPSRDDAANEVAMVERPATASSVGSRRNAELDSRSAEVAAVPANDESAISAYERLRALRSRAQGLAGAETVAPAPRIAGRIDVDAVERQTQPARPVMPSLADPTNVRPRGVTAFDDSTNKPSVYPTTVAHLPPLQTTPQHDPWNTASEAVRNARQMPQQETRPATINSVPRDPWGNPLTTDASSGVDSFGTSNTLRGSATTTQAMPQPKSSAGQSRGVTDIQVQGSDDRTTDRATVANTPVLEVTTQGPQSIVVGQESAYRIKISNRTSATAEQVVCSIELPSWVDIQPPDVSAGTTDILPAETGDTKAKLFRWKLDKIDPRGEDQLVLYLIPRERKAFSLQLHYDFKRPSAVTEIDVREPRLEMSLDGPGKVLWGSEEVYRLRIRNVGNGDAESIQLVLLSSSDTEGSSVEPFVLDMLKAGEEKTLEVKAWARQNDVLEINVIATGPYNLEAKTSRRVLVMRPQLEVSVDAPSLQFVGNTGEATITVRNNGNAPADNVEIIATLPLGAKYISNTLGGNVTPQNDVVWSVESIPVGGEFIAKVMCELRRPGACRFDASVREQTGLLVKGTATTDVESIADLSMKLQNPQGPIELGAEALYTVTLTNRGTCAAENVEVVIAFAEQVDPVRIEGMSGEIDAARGMVVFDKIQSLGPGQPLSLQVYARAKSAGTHKVRAEVICESTNTHIAHEESNLFYAKQRAAEPRNTEKAPPPKMLDSGASVPPAVPQTTAPSVTTPPVTVPEPFEPVALPSPAKLPTNSPPAMVPSPFGPTTTLPPLK